MKKLPIIFKVGTRPSKLAITQAEGALKKIECTLVPHRFEIKAIKTKGDLDLKTSLLESPNDFFTDALDAALLNGDIDCAIHSAKDLPDKIIPEIDWFWLPSREDPRDAIVLREEDSIENISATPIFGISSERRANYVTKYFPSAIQKPIRGNIEERLRQLDDGDFDAIIMAAAALNRLNMQSRIKKVIPEEQLEVPDGQGFLAITFRRNDKRFQKIRSLFTPSVIIAGAGVGHRDLCTVSTIQALKRCEICLYDSLMDQRLLDYLPDNAEAIDVGKRCGAHSKEQHEITHLLCQYARRSKRIVRLKGGDPGIFGRLAEETEALEDLSLAYYVIPGISALQAATTGTGMLLTRRNLSRGFIALTPREAAGKIAPCGKIYKSSLPTLYYMAIKAMEPITKELLDDGVNPKTPVAVIYNAGARDQEIIQTSLENLPEHGRESCINKPGLILIGENSTYKYNKTFGALEGARILLTCSNALQQRASDLVHDYGGIPISFPLIQLKPRFDCALHKKDTDWIIISSPSSARAYLEIIEFQKIDYRSIPKIMVCGQETANVFELHGIHVDVKPDKNYSAEALIKEAKKILKKGHNILRLRSDKAGPNIAKALRETGANVTDTILYDNHPIIYDDLPNYDMIFFASSSGVENFITKWGIAILRQKTVIAIGKPTAKTLEKNNVKSYIIAKEATVKGAIDSLAAHNISNSLYGLD